MFEFIAGGELNHGAETLFDRIVERSCRLAALLPLLSLSSREIAPRAQGPLVLSQRATMCAGEWLSLSSIGLQFTISAPSAAHESAPFWKTIY